MEDWIGVVVFLAIGLLSVVSQAGKAAKKPGGQGGTPDYEAPGEERSGHWGVEPEATFNDVYSAGSQAVMGEGGGDYTFGRDHNAETTPRRAVSADPVSVSSVAANPTEDGSAGINPSMIDFDLRRAVIETEILTPKYF